MTSEQHKCRHSTPGHPPHPNSRRKTNALPPCGNPRLLEQTPAGVCSLSRPTFRAQHLCLSPGTARHTHRCARKGQVLRSPLHRSLQGKGAAPSRKSPEAQTAPASWRENSPLGLRVSSLLPARVFCQRQGPSWAAHLVLTISLVKINTANISNSSCH